LHHPAHPDEPITGTADAPRWWQDGRVRALGIRLGATALCALLAAGCSAASKTSARPSATKSAGPTASASLSAAPLASTAPPSPSASTATSPGARRYVFPVDGRTNYEHTHHDYPATDIFAPCGTVVRAVTAGVVLEVSREDRFDPANPQGADKGGLSVSILGDDGVRYYGSHFSAIDQSVQPGVRVAPGTRLGLVGHTGNASGICHLHFGLSPVCGRTGDWWIRRGVLYPWPYLDAWKAGTARSPAPDVEQWRAAHGCPPAPPA
jgi:peptidoglycan LD-endopeptidase LytH